MTTTAEQDWGQAAWEAVRDLIGVGEGMAVLRQLLDVRDLLEQGIASNIHAARSQGASWEDIGQALGVSRQAAWERYR